MTLTNPAAARPRVVMFVHNDATNDSRVLREAATLAAAGYAVTLIARTRRTDPSVILRERLGDVDLIRVPLPTRWRRTMSLLVTPWRQWREDARAIRAGMGRPGCWPGIARLLLTRLATLAVSVLLLPAGVVWFAVGRSRYRELVQWTLRWRFGTLGWNRAAAAVAPVADVYHGHDLSALPAAAEAATRNGGLLVYDSHEVFLESGANARRPGWARAMLSRLERRFAGQASALVTVNAALAEVLTSRLPIRRAVVVHNCPPRWTPAAAHPGHLRAAAGIGPEVPLVLYHGGFSAHRGLEQLTAALLAPGMESVHAAYLGYGSMRGWLDAQAADPRYGGRLHVIDAVPPDILLDWVADADAGVMAIQPSTLNHRLSTPNKLFECMAAGVPSVVSDMPGMRAIALDPELGPVGEVCDPADPASIAAAMQRILELAPAARADLRARCLRAAHERWNWEVESGRLLALYEELAPIGASGPAA